MEAQEPLIHWPQPIIEFLSFLASYLASGAIGFRFAALGAALRPGSGLIAEERDVSERAAARAAGLGFLGGMLSLALLLQRLPAFAEQRHLGVLELLRTDGSVQTAIALLVVVVGGFALAARRRDYGWPIAGIAVIAFALRAVATLQWQRLVNPIHVLAGGLWVGTLAMLVIAGLATVFASRLDTERRGALAARMVHGFSPLALASAAVLALFGVITAWRHLGEWRLLWTTPYGVALLVKLGVVAMVVSLGAWNWRRQKPRLGSEDAAHALRASAKIELALALLVLVVTAVLVSLPDARPPGR
jgi:putative copper export protein